MNTERVLQLADYIELPETRFSMGMWAYCLAGNAAALFDARPTDTDTPLNIFDWYMKGRAAMRALDLTESEAKDLFMGKWAEDDEDGNPFDIIDITKSEAVAHLRSLAAAQTEAA